MAQPANVKKLLEAAGSGIKAQNVTQADARTVALSWHAICDDPGTSNDLRSLAILKRRDLEGAIARNDTVGKEAALMALSNLASNYS